MYGTRGRIDEPAVLLGEEGVEDDDAQVQKGSSSGANG